MVKVFLYESTIDCFNQLKYLYENLTNCCILVPNRTYQQNCIHFYKDSISVFTPSEWMKNLGLNPLKTEESLLIKTYDTFNDPTLITLKDLKSYPKTFQDEWIKWMKYEKINAFTDIIDNYTSNLHFHSAILYGQFNTSVQDYLLRSLKNLHIACYQILHIYKKSFLSENNQKNWETNKHLQVISFQNVFMEQQWVQKFLEKNPQTFCIQPLEQTYEPLLRKRAITLLDSWLDWQEQANLSYFLIYLDKYLVKDKKLFEQTKEKLEQAFSICLTNQFKCLQAYILKKESHWIKNFTQGDWPKEASFTDFIQILQKVLPENFKNFFKEIPNFNIKIIQKHFFNYLRRFINHNFKHFNTLKHFEEVLYFPFDNYLIPNCIYSQNEKNNYQLINFIHTTLANGKKIIVCSSQKNLKNETIKPLLNPKKIFELPTKEQKSLINKTKLHLPPQLLNRLSCKNWENFYLYPLQTWLKVLLKTQKIPLHYSKIKEKIIGEWVHQNLQFKQQPDTLKKWLDFIKKISDQRWIQLQAIFKQQNQNIPEILINWHLKSLSWSQKIATSCQDLLSWKLYSEWTLPDNAPIKGRIDLLAINNDTAIITDYKTSLHYLFSANQIDKGHGLQLYLYGKYLNTLKKSLILRVIDCFGKITQLDFNEIKVSNIENWISSIQKSGQYTSIPSAKLKDMPISIYKQ